MKSLLSNTILCIIFMLHISVEGIEKLHWQIYTVVDFAMY